ncbi:MAG: thioredoxin domain-containing protein [Candidatus Nomurabacteria bacterium]|nr:thioredoxin domain-containing protein [Candidatus Nomurabacteria bacterium]
MDNNKTKQMVSVLIVLAVIAVGYFLLRDSKPPATEPVTIEGIEVNPGETNTANTGSGLRPITADDHILGNTNAKLVIVEYSDTECPFCKQFHNTMQNVIENNNGNVAWVYRHYPIAQLHQKAFHEAEATECAWDQGGNTGFWKYTNELYRVTQSNDRLPTEDLTKIAGAVGLNVKTFNTCLNSGKFAEKINADMMDGQLNGVQGTPTSFILMNGKVVDMIEGAQTEAGVQQQIDRLLK